MPNIGGRVARRATRPTHISHDQMNEPSIEIACK